MLYRIRTLLIILLCVGLITACAGASTPVEVNLASSSVSTGGTTRIVTDALGNSVEIPLTPKRIVAQDYLGELLVLGIHPVGTPARFFDESDLFTSYLTGIERIGEANMVNLEKVAQLEPDLILINQYLDMGVIKKLVKIAPTIHLHDSEDVFTRLTKMGELFDKSAEAQAWIDEYTHKQVVTKENLASFIRPEEKALIVSMWQDIIWVQATRSVGQTIYNSVGFIPVDKVTDEFNAIMSGVNTDQSGYLEISFEVFPEYAADADRIFVLLDTDEESQKKYKTYLTNPLWQAVPAVKNNKVYMLDSRWGWYNPIGLGRELDDIVSLLGAKE